MVVCCAKDATLHGIAGVFRFPILLAEHGNEMQICEKLQRLALKANNLQLMPLRHKPLMQKNERTKS